MKRMSLPSWGFSLLTSIRRTRGRQIDMPPKKIRTGPKPQYWRGSRGRRYSPPTHDPRKGNPMRYVLAILAFAFAPMAGAQVDNATINRIIDEELNHSELPQTAEYLTDRIGGRMTH